MIMDRESIGENIRKLRLEKRISLSRMAREVGKSRVTLDNWETGKTPIPDYGIDACARVLGVNTDILLADNRPPNANQDFYDLIKTLASEDPDLILQFSRLSKNAHKLDQRDKRFLVDMFRTALGRLEVKNETNTF